MTHRGATTHTCTHTHTWGPGLSAITAQWNIFRLERCRITLQPDDKYAVSTIINLVPLPTFRLQTRWCKGRGACIHWMELVPQLGLQRCCWCMHRAVALPCSTRSHKQKRSGHSDSLGSLVMSVFGKAGCWVELRSRWFFIWGLLQWKTYKTPPHLLHALSLLFSSCPQTLPVTPFTFTSLSFFCLSLLFISEHTAFCCHPAFFYPKGLLTYCPERHFILSGHCLANEQHA